MREWGEWVREKVEGISVELVKTEKKNLLGKYEMWCYF